MRVYQFVIITFCIVSLAERTQNFCYLHRMNSRY